MASLSLFEGVEWDGENVFPHVDAQFDSKISSVTTYQKDVDFIRIGEPILVDMSHAEAIKYGYGILKVDDVKYFITITKIDVQKANAVYLSYNVDWFTTLRYRDAVSIGRCHLIRSSDVDPTFYEQPIQPKDMRYYASYNIVDPRFSVEKMYTDMPMNHKYFVMSIMEKGAGDYGEQKIYFSPIDYTNGIYKSITTTEIIQGRYVELFDIKPDDIAGIWVTSIQPFMGENPSYIEKPMDETTGRYWYEATNSAFANRHLPHTITGMSFKATQMEEYYLVDTLGNIIYQVPRGRILEGFHIQTSYGLTELEFVFSPLYYGSVDGYDVGRTVENSFFRYSVPTLDYINSTFANWSSGMRGIEAEERRIQRTKALTQGIGSSALTGALGLTAGPIGGALGLAGGLGSAALSYGTDAHYENETQELEDQKYQEMPDTAVTGTYTFTFPDAGLSLVHLKARQEDINRYNTEIRNYGATCVMPLERWTPRVGVYKFADAEIIANVPYDIKDNIRTKLRKGIRIVR